MTIPDEPTVIAAVAAALGAITTYLLGRRKTSGEVHTTDADALWAEQGRFRQNLQLSITSMQARIDHLEDEKSRCLEKLATLEGQINFLTERLRRKSDAE